MTSDVALRSDTAQAVLTRKRLDLLGALLIIAGLGWTFVSGLVSGGDPRGGATLLVAVAAAFWVARIVAGGVSPLVPAFVALVIGSAGVAFAADLFASGPLRGPLGYTNASAALYLQGVVASLMVVAGSRDGLRAAGWAGALAFGAATLLTGSQAATALLVLPAIAMMAFSPRATKRVISSFLLLFLGAFGLTVVIGIAYPIGTSSALGRVIDATLTERRAALWHDAVVLVWEEPLTGVGQGRFRYESDVARSDRDAAWTHNGFLQQGAEGGFPALVLAVSLFVWGLVRLGVREPDAVSALGAASVAALGIQACIDYVLHFPALPITVAALLGAAVGGEQLRQGKLRGLA